MLMLFMFDDYKPKNINNFFLLYNNYDYLVTKLIVEILNNTEFWEKASLESWKAIDRNSEKILALSEASRKMYIYKVVRSKCFDIIKRSSYKHENVSLSYIESLPADLDIHQEVENKETLENIHKVLLSFSQTERNVFLLKARHGLSMKKIAEILDISYDKVRRDYNKVLKAIRREMRLQK